MGRHSVVRKFAWAATLLTLAFAAAKFADAQASPLPAVSMPAMHFASAPLSR